MSRPKINEITIITAVSSQVDVFRSNPDAEPGGLEDVKYKFEDGLVLVGHYIRGPNPVSAREFRICALYPQDTVNIHLGYSDAC